MRGNSAIARPSTTVTNDLPKRTVFQWHSHCRQALLLGMILIAVWLGWVINRAQKQNAAISAIARSDGIVAFPLTTVADYETDWSDLIADQYRWKPMEIYLPAYAIDDGMLEHLNNLPPGSTLCIWCNEEKLDLTARLPALTITYSLVSDREGLPTIDPPSRRYSPNKTQRTRGTGVTAFK